jgi:hypothetical protein
MDATIAATPPGRRHTAGCLAAAVRPAWGAGGRAVVGCLQPIGRRVAAASDAAVNVRVVLAGGGDLGRGAGLDRVAGGRPDGGHVQAEREPWSRARSS